MRNNFVERKNTEKQQQKQYTHTRIKKEPQSRGAKEREIEKELQFAICRTKCCLCHYDSFRMQRHYRIQLGPHICSPFGFVDVATMCYTAEILLRI